MEIILKDLIKLSILTIVWLSCLYLTSKDSPLHEALKYVPMHLIITIGYIAGVKVCYNIIIIKDCTDEYNTLLSEISEAREFYTKNKIKYN
jgi:hypothetical protein